MYLPEPELSHDMDPLYLQKPIYRRGVETLGKPMPKKSTAAPKTRFRPYCAQTTLTSDSEPPPRLSTPTPGGRNPGSNFVIDPPAQIDITGTTLYWELTRPRNLPQFRKRPLVVLHEDTTTVLTVLVFPQGGIISPSMNSVLNNPAPTPSSVLKSLHNCIALLNKSSEHLRHLGHLNLPPKPSDETLAHTATQSPEWSPKHRPTDHPHLTNLVCPLNQTPRLDPPLLTFLPSIPAPVQDTHLVQQEALCHRLDHKDQVARAREETLCDCQRSRQRSTHTSVPYTPTAELVEEVHLMIGPRDAHLRPLMEIETSMTDGSTRS